MISPKQKTLIQQVINVFETGTPEGKYDALVIFADGKDGSRQITYGRSQTTEQGNLRELIEMYIANNGRFAQDFSPFVARIGVTPLTNNSAFKDLLKTAARQDSVMRETQDEFFDKRYWKPAQKWFDKNGFQEPLSMLVIYDSYIHSGSIRSFLRRRFRAVPPAKALFSEIGWRSDHHAIDLGIAYHFQSSPDLCLTTRKVRNASRAL